MLHSQAPGKVKLQSKNVSLCWRKVLTALRDQVLTVQTFDQAGSCGQGWHVKPEH